jgi:hypothetical protein
MAQGAWWRCVLEARHDVVGLCLIDPNWYLASTTGISKQNDGASAGGIESDASDAHLNHGDAPMLTDYD